MEDDKAAGKEVSLVPRSMETIEVENLVKVHHDPSNLERIA